MERAHEDRDESFLAELRLTHPEFAAAAEVRWAAYRVRDAADHQAYLTIPAVDCVALRDVAGALEGNDASTPMLAFEVVEGYSRVLERFAVAWGTAPSEEMARVLAVLRVVTRRLRNPETVLAQLAARIGTPPP